MNRLLLTLMIAAVGSLLFLWPTAGQIPSAQIPPPAKRATRVQITEGPALESATDNGAIIRWTSNNPGGSDEHFGVVQYGTDPKNLNETAKSHIRLNRGHSYTIFRVRLNALKPKTTYYYRVTSIESNGKSDGEESAVNRFTTPGPDEVIAASPPQAAPQSK